MIADALCRVNTAAGGCYVARSAKQCRERWHNHLDPQVVCSYGSMELVIGLAG